MCQATKVDMELLLTCHLQEHLKRTDLQASYLRTSADFLILKGACVKMRTSSMMDVIQKQHKWHDPHAFNM